MTHRITPSIYTQHFEAKSDSSSSPDRRRPRSRARRVVDRHLLERRRDLMSRERRPPRPAGGASATRFFGKYRGIVTDVSRPRGDAAHPRDRPGGVRAGAVALGDAGTAVRRRAARARHAAGDRRRRVDRVRSRRSDASDLVRRLVRQRARAHPQGEKVRVLASSDAATRSSSTTTPTRSRSCTPAEPRSRCPASEIVLKLGACELKITTTEISLNNGMVKVTTAGVSLVERRDEVRRVSR